MCFSFYFSVYAVKPPKKSIGYPDLLQEPVNAHYGEIKKCASTILPTSGHARPKVKTNGHFTSLMQVGEIKAPKSLSAGENFLLT